MLDTLLRALLLVVSGTLLLRIAGRKAISQMTIAQTVVMISIGSLIIQPINESSIWRTLLAASIFIIALVLMEYLQVRFDYIEKFITGKSIIVVENGELKSDTLRKLRMTVDQLEMRLRQQGIRTFKDIKTATLEPNGQVGYELMRHAQPVTIGDLENLLSQLNIPQSKPQEEEGHFFKEINQRVPEQAQYPERLQ